MTDHELNGDAKVILTRLHEIERRLVSLENSLTENLKFHRDHPLCPAPGMCIRLEKQIENNANEIESLALRLDETRLIAPFIITHIVNGAK